MAIERMKCVWLFAPRAGARQLLDRVAAMGLSHVSDCGLPASDELEALGIEQVFPDVGDLERRVQILRDILETLGGFYRTSREFLANFITTPIEVRRRDVEQALAELDPESLRGRVKELERRHGSLLTALEKAKTRLRFVEPLERLDVIVPGSKAQRRIAVFLGVMSRVQYDNLVSSGRLPPESAVAAAGTVGKQLAVEAACPADAAEELLALLQEYRFEQVEPEEEPLRIRDYVAKRRAEVESIEGELSDVRHTLREIAMAERRKVELALGYWEERLDIANAAAMLARSKRLTIMKGYVRERDLQVFRERVSRELPDTAVLVRDPRPGEPVPVSLRNHKFFAPAQFLVEMFGMPNYFTFDPTAFILFSFTIFFGFCFGDAVYGLMMIAMGLALARKYREYPGYRNFFTLLAYAGVTTFIVGALTGGWLCDLFTPQYIGEGNILVRLRERLMVADMIERSLAALGVALLLGVLNQLFSVVCLMVRRFKEGDPLGAVFDGAFWLLVLPGLVVLAAGMFIHMPPLVARAALWAIVVGAVGLVLTQGRAEKSILGKIVVGLVSLYGIVGTYGATTFIGDTLSYSRLLALGLTTAIVGMCFNLIGALARGIPYLGIVIFVMVLIGGHLMNFFISMLGGFVHSARLIFVEFFGKFYQGDAPAFAPLGTWRGRIRVTDSPTVWCD